MTAGVAQRGSDVPVADAHPAAHHDVVRRRAEPPAAPRRGREPATVWSLLASLRRRWYVTLLGAVATVIGAHAAATAPGVYYQQAYVVFLDPGLSPTANPYQLVPYSLIAAAGLVGRQAHPEVDQALPVSAAVTLVDMGVRDGMVVRVPRDGGQWDTSFHRAVLDVEVVGSDPAAVSTKLTATVATIRQTLDDGQRRMQVPRSRWITTALQPPAPTPTYRAGDPGRALMASLALGAGATVAAAAGLDLVLRSRRRVVPQHATPAARTARLDG